MADGVVMRWRFREVGGHVHVRVFAGRVPDALQPEGYTLGKAGDLTFRLDEWPAVRRSVELADVQVIEEGE